MMMMVMIITEQFCLLGYNMSLTSSLSEELCLLPASRLFLLGLFFDFEDGSDMFFRNIG
jgi:hypothetical protein